MIRSIECTDIYLKNWIGQAIVLTAAVIFSVLLSIMERKRTQSNQQGCCTLIVPVNLWEMKGHASMVLAAFTLAAVQIINNLVLDNGLQFHTTAVLLRVAITLILIAFITLTYLPLFACITVNNVGSNIIGLIYVMLIVILTVLILTPACSFSEMSVFQIAVMLEFNIIALIAGLVLIVKFILRLLGKSYTREDVIFKIQMEQLEYVKKLLTNKKRNDMSLEDVCVPRGLGKVKAWFQNKIYKPITGFRYSLNILVTIYVGLLSVIVVGIIYMASCSNSLYEIKLQAIEWRKGESADSPIPPILQVLCEHMLRNKLEETTQDKYQIIINFIERQGTTIFAAAIFSLILATFSSIYHSLAFAKSYRQFKLNLEQRRALEELLDLNKLPTARIMVLAIQFAGFQIAYMIWGYHVQAGLVFLVTMLLSETIILPSDSLLAFVINFLKFITPVVVFTITILIVQCVVVRKYLLHNSGQTLALKNRKCYLYLTYIMYFYNIFNGSFACMNRFIKWLFTGIWFYLRLDRTILARNLEKCDIGLLCFASLLKMENTENNPIVNTFLAMFSDDGVFDQQLRTSNFYGKMISSRKNLPYKRWFLALTLLRNESLKADRRPERNPLHSNLLVSESTIKELTNTNNV